MPSHPRRTSPRPPAWPVLALVTVSGLALALWGAAFWQLGTTAGSQATAPTTSGHVIACARAPFGSGCTVRYDAPDGSVRSRTLDRPGLVGVEAGEDVPLWIAADESIGVAGWRAWVDGLILLVLAATTTSGAIRWLAQVLRGGDPITVFDLGDEADGLGRRRRAAG